jgi:hypothetical protein
MTSIDTTLRQLESTWTNNRVEVQSGLEISIACTLRTPAKEQDFDLLRSVVEKVPSSLLEFWSISNGARLFEDVTFGQWGLELLSIQDSVAASTEFERERTTEARPGDLVVGKFFGDSDVLLARCAPEVEDYGMILIALPMDSRRDWYVAAAGFEEFLKHYIQVEGSKFWV